MLERGLARSRSQARGLVVNGRVHVASRAVTKPATLVDDEVPIEIVGGGQRWVSRGAEKLSAALEQFPVAVDGKPVLDVGASTGGFTQVCLDKGASRVVALDVGHGQLDPLLRNHNRVVDLEGTNIRDFSNEDGDPPCFDVVVVDLSFISLRKVANTLSELSCRGADVIALVKPQFETDRSSLGKGGILRDSEKRIASVRSVIESFREAGLGPRGIIKSPITGGDRNVEYLLWAQKGTSGVELEVPA